MKSDGWPGSLTLQQIELTERVSLRVKDGVELSPRYSLKVDDLARGKLAEPKLRGELDHGKRG